MCVRWQEPALSKAKGCIATPWRQYPSRKVLPKRIGAATWPWKAAAAQQAYKPSSVPPRPRRGAVTINLGRRLPATSSGQPEDRPGVLVSSYLALLHVGFAQPTGHPAAGELLPHHFTLTPTSPTSGRCVSVALSVGLPRLGVTQHDARWSSDFPHPGILHARARSPGLLSQPYCNAETAPCQASRLTDPGPGWPACRPGHSLRAGWRSP